VAVKSNSASSSRNPKDPPSSQKPPAFIVKPARSLQPPSCFSRPFHRWLGPHKVHIGRPRFRAFISAYADGRSTSQAGSLSDLPIRPKPILSQIPPMDGFLHDTVLRSTPATGPQSVCRPNLRRAPFYWSTTPPPHPVRKLP
jgi:hypothetical protein